MRNSKRICALLALVLSATIAFAQTGMQVKQNNAVAEQAAMDKLQEAWSSFADALLQQDTARLRSLSATTVRCDVCPIDTILPGNASAEEYNKRKLMPFHDFLKKAPQLFYPATLSRLKDTSKLMFTDNEHNAALYPLSGIPKAIRLNHPRYKEVLLTVVDPSADYEGAQQAFAFVETKDGFKFCGYSTIP
ncbi:hypothetical protein [Taibaiella koreensis]|uniref:hypothetical protein n=1 Tax=Taibaiella koreensis TaxID=1268548 RepID=UPI0013C37431|nr:hypothetical protein [Taibaiella koreensis]